MTDDQTQSRLDNIERKLDDISETLSQIAVQRDRLERLDEQMRSLWKRYDTLVEPDGILSKISAFQASCPRNQVRWVWVTLVPLIFTQLAFGIALLRCMPQ